MRKWILLAIAVVVLSACGVDGEPVQPSLNAGIGISDSGVYAGGSLGLHKGPLSLYLGF